MLTNNDMQVSALKLQAAELITAHKGEHKVAGANATQHGFESSDHAPLKIMTILGTPVNKFRKVTKTNTIPAWIEPAKKRAQLTIGEIELQ